MGLRVPVRVSTGGMLGQLKQTEAIIGRKSHRRDIMSNKAIARISGLLTFFILIAVAILSVFAQMLVLNGVSESQAFNALIISVICQSVGLFPAILLARWLPNLLITKMNMNTFLAILIAVIVATGLGAVVAFLAVIVATLAVGVR